MRTSFKSQFQGIAILAATGVLLSLFSCSGANPFFKRSQSSGNGEGYSGKLTRYEYYSETTPCSLESTSSDRPPNDVIFLTTEKNAQLVRENCEDIEPETITDITIDSSGDTLSYSNKTFAVSTADTSRKLQTLCPTGESYVNSTQASNLISSPIDFFADSWYVQDGVDITLEGAIGGTPNYLITRNSSYPDWSRILEVINLSAATRYAASAIVTADTNQVARFLFSLGGTVILEVDVDIVTGASSIINQPNATGIEVQTVAHHGGQLVYLYFVSDLSGGIDIGIGPSPDNAGNSIKATALRLINNTTEICQ